MHTSKNSDWFVVPVVINGVKTEMKMDTASQISLFTSSTWAKLGKPKLQKPGVNVKNCNNVNFNLIGKFQCYVSYNGNHSKQMMGYVSDSIVHDVLGIPWIKQLELLPPHLLEIFRHKTTSYSAAKSYSTNKSSIGQDKKVSLSDQLFKENTRNANHGTKFVKFANGESIFLLNYRFGKTHWLPGKIIEQVKNSPNFRVEVPSLGRAVHRHSNQIRRRLEDMSSPPAQVEDHASPPRVVSPLVPAHHIQRIPRPKREVKPTRRLTPEPSKKRYAYE
jgi:hypothetical protein